jgi:hypothetical protein
LDSPAVRLRPVAASGSDAGARSVMLTLTGSTSVFLACGATDLRKSIDLLE